VLLLRNLDLFGFTRLRIRITSKYSNIHNTLERKEGDVRLDLLQSPSSAFFSPFHYIPNVVVVYTDSSFGGIFAAFFFSVPCFLVCMYRTV
jgi:hypothetical protein